MFPYTSYFQDGQSVPAQWGLGTNAAKFCAIWNDVRTLLNDTYPDAMRDEVKTQFKQRKAIYDDPSTTNSYDLVEVEISKAQYKELVDIERATILFRMFSTPSLKQQAQKDYRLAGY